MSSGSVRNALRAAVDALAAPMPVFDMSDYQSISDIPVNTMDTFILIQYIGGDDSMVTIGGEGNQGFEETGVAALHIVTPTGFDSANTIQTADNIRLGLRGRRLTQDVVVEAVEPFTDQVGAAIQIDGGYHGYSSNLFYSKHDCG